MITKGNLKKLLSILEYTQISPHRFKKEFTDFNFLSIGAWRAIRSCEKELRLTIAATATNPVLIMQLKFIRSCQFN